MKRKTISLIERLESLKENSRSFHSTILDFVPVPKEDMIPELRRRLGDINQLIDDIQDELKTIDRLKSTQEKLKLMLQKTDEYDFYIEAREVWDSLSSVDLASGEDQNA